jgi:hypothetical protein
MSVSATRVLAVVVLLLGLGLVAGPTPTLAQESVTVVSEDVTADTTWSAEDGPYRVVANVSVAGNASLSIGPGTTVQVAEGVSISVAGELVANGTDEEPARFVSSDVDPVPGAWGSIRTTGTGEPSVSLANVRLSHATHGVAVSNPRSSVRIADSTVESLSGDGIHVRAAEGAALITVSGTQFQAIGGAGIDARRSAIVPVRAVTGWSITDSTFSDLGDAGVSVHADRVTTVTLRNATVSGVDGPAVGVDTERLRATDLRENHVDRAITGFDVETADASAVAIADNDLAVTGTAVDVSLERNVYALRIRDNSIAGGGAGIVVDHDPREGGFYSFDLAVRENEVRETDRNGITVRTSLFSDATFGVRENTVTKAGRFGMALSVTTLENANVSENWITDSARTGLEVSTRRIADTSFRGNTVRDAGGSGIALAARESIERVDVEANHLLNNARDGVTIRTRMVTEGNYTVTDNVIAANAYGVALAGPQTAQVSGNAIVHNSRALGPVLERTETAPGVGVLVRRGAANVTLRDNDVYGNRIGLATHIDGTVTAPDNYWGAPSGPYHSSINPEGEGDPVVTTDGWVRIGDPRAERVNRRYSRPVANVSVSPRPARPNRMVRISGAQSTDPDGTVRNYRFTVNGSTSLSTAPNRSQPFESVGTYPVSLWVEDDMGIESESPAGTEVTVERAPTTTTAPEPTTVDPTTDDPTTVDPTTTEEPERTGPGLLGWFGGGLGAVFYGIALVLGLRGTYQTIAERPLTVRGRRIQLYAAIGVLVWALASIPGPSILLIVAGGGLGLWIVGTGLAYVAIRVR